jgi:hypothetical protein
MDGINKIFVPLNGTPIYRTRAVILCDAPSPAAQQDFNNFRASYRDLEANRQLHVTTVQSLEEYYPEPWRKTAEEVDQLRQQRGAKVQTATTVGQAITQEAFEQDMPIFKAALDRCWELSHA